MAGLTHTRCFNHAGREAVARCTSCEHYFCRECVTEHEDRMTCTNCLAQRVAGNEKPRRSFAGIFGFVQFVVGLLVLWIAIYGVGRGLLLLSDDFHEGTLWQQDPWEIEE